MRYGSVCSGIEAATAAWHPLGWVPEFFSEIEPFPCAVLAHHYPHVPNHGDMTKFEEWPDAALDVLVGGTPCQSFSVAGLRKGLADPRGNLMLTFGAIARRYRPTWLVWENVPGVLSSNGGRDFGTFLGMLGELGYGFAYRVLDAQYFGVAQRRRRVFVVGCLGDWRRAAAVLFERHSLSGHPAPSREAREGSAAVAARSVALRGRDGGGTVELGDDCGLTLRASGGGGDKAHVMLARCDTTGEGKRQDYETCTLIAHSLRGEGFDVSEDGTGRGTPLVPVAIGSREVAGTLTSNYGKQPDSSDTGLGPNLAISFGAQNSARQGDGVSAECVPTLDKSKTPGVMQSAAVRRLTPRECERLQGFRDDFTLVPVRGKPAADGPRYKALGNSMAVPVMAWIGSRIKQVVAIQGAEVAA